jgi:hypothetical protein
MKKIYSFIAATILAVGMLSAQCTIDPQAQTTPGANPTADNLPCIERGVAYDQTVQGKIQDSQDTTISGVNAHIVIDSVQIDSIVGLPTGINWAVNPTVLEGGGNGCVRFTGTTTDAAGNYLLTAYGKVWIRLTSPAPYSYTYNGDLNRFSPFGDYYVDVIEQGAPCRSTGINNFSADLNSALSVYPNPSTGKFEFTLDAGKRVNGEIRIVDASGKQVFNQLIDVVGKYNTSIDLSNMPKGLYVLQVKTAEGFAAKNISIQ